MSLKESLVPAEHVRLGAALAPLRSRGVLILCSGALTHNFKEMTRGKGSGEVAPWVAEFEVR